MIRADVSADASLPDVVSSGGKTRLKPDLAAAVNCF